MESNKNVLNVFDLEKQLLSRFISLIRFSCSWSTVAFLEFFMKINIMILLYNNKP